MVFDFNNLTALQIPEGSVAEIAIGGQTVWSAEKWDLSWVYHGNLPGSEEWNYTPGADTVFVDAEKGAVVVKSPDLNAWTTLSAGLKTGFLFSSPSVLEIEFMYGSAGTAGKTVVELGVSPDRCVRCEMSQSSNGDARISTPYKNEAGTISIPNRELTKDEWHTLRIELDEGMKSFALLDGEVLMEYDYSMLYTPGREGASLMALNASVWIRKLRYKGYVPA